MHLPTQFFVGCYNHYWNPAWPFSCYSSLQRESSLIMRCHALRFTCFIFLFISVWLYENRTLQGLAEYHNCFKCFLRIFLRLKTDCYNWLVWWDARLSTDRFCTSRWYHKPNIDIGIVIHKRQNVDFLFCMNLLCRWHFHYFVWNRHNA